MQRSEITSRKNLGDKMVDKEMSKYTRPQKEGDFVRTRQRYTITHVSRPEKNDTGVAVHRGLQMIHQVQNKLYISARNYEQNQRDRPVGMPIARTPAEQRRPSADRNTHMPPRTKPFIKENSSKIGEGGKVQAMLQNTHMLWRR